MIQRNAVGSRQGLFKKITWGKGRVSCFQSQPLIACEAGGISRASVSVLAAKP